MPKKKEPDNGVLANAAQPDTRTSSAKSHPTSPDGSLNHWVLKGSSPGRGGRGDESSRSSPRGRDRRKSKNRRSQSKTNANTSRSRSRLRKATTSSNHSEQYKLMCATIGTDSSEDDGEDADPGLTRATALRETEHIRTDMDDISSGEEAIILSPPPLGLKDDTTTHDLVHTPLGLTLQESANDSTATNHTISAAALVSPTAIKAATTSTGPIVSASAPSTATKAATTDAGDNSALVSPKTATKAATATPGIIDSAATGNSELAAVKAASAATIRNDTGGSAAEISADTANKPAKKASKAKSKKATLSKKHKINPKQKTHAIQNTPSKSATVETTVQETVQETVPAIETSNIVTTPGLSRVNPDTSLLATNDSDIDDEVNEASNTGESLSPISKFSLPASDPPATTPKKPTTTYSRVHWYLLWDEVPSFVTNSLPNSNPEAWVQLWLPRAIDFLHDHGILFHIGCMDRENPIKAIKRGDQPISTQLTREVCSYDDFQDFFEIQPLFTHLPQRVEVTFFQRLKASTMSQAEHLHIIGALRAQFGIATGNDPFAMKPPKIRIHPGFLPSATPAERQAYFLACCGSPIRRSNLLRFTLRVLKKNLPSIVVDEGKTADKELQKHLGGMLDKLQELTESSLAVIQYKSEYSLAPLTLREGSYAEQFEAMSVGTLRRYVNRYSLPRPGQDFWAEIFLAFNGDAKSFNRDSYYELDRDFGAALYQKGIQTSEYADKPYWLLYSHPQIDYSYLEKELLKLTGTEIEIRRKDIQDGVKKKKPAKPVASIPGSLPVTDPDRSDKAEAFHLSCGSDHLQHVSIVLPSLFNSSRLAQSRRSLTTNIRLVTVHGSAVTEGERTYQISARQRQVAYVLHSRTFVINTILDLDKEVMGLHGPISLRTFILRLTRPSDPKDEEPLFVEMGPKLHSPDKVVLIVRPEAYSEAEPIVAGLLPMAIHYHGAALKAAFHPSARIAMADVEWDPIRRVAISPQDKIYDNIAAADDWLAFENLDDIVVPAEDTDQRMADAVPAAEPPTAAEMAAGQAMMGEDDENTLGSLRDAMAGKPAPVKKKARKKALDSSAPSTLEDVANFKCALRRVYAKVGMDFDSDDESISTTLSVKNQMAGLHIMLLNVDKKSDQILATKTSKENDSTGSAQASGESSGTQASDATAKKGTGHIAAGSVVSTALG